MNHPDIKNPDIIKVNLLVISGKEFTDVIYNPSSSF